MQLHVRRNTNQETSFLNSLYLYDLRAPIQLEACVDDVCFEVFSCSAIDPSHRVIRCPDPWSEGWLSVSPLLLHHQEMCQVGAYFRVIDLLDRRVESVHSILQGLGEGLASSCISIRPFQTQIAPNVQSKMRLGVPFPSIDAPMHRFYPKRHPYARSSRQFDRLQGLGDSTIS